MLVNMTPSSKTDGRIPYELCYRHIPSITYTKVFGCNAYVHITEQYRDRLDAQARLCMYLGMPDHKKGYRLMDINTHAIVYSRGVVLKNFAPSTTPAADLAPTITPSANPTAAAKSDSSSPPASKRPRLTNDDEEVTLKSEEDQQEQKQRRQLLYTLLAIRYVTEPPTYRVTMKTAQYTGTGEIDRFKARLVIKSFLQEHGIDYNKIFAPVIKMEVLRLLFTIAVQMGLEIHQMDVKTAFLNGFLEEEICMAQPEGFPGPGQAAPRVQNPEEPVWVKTSSPTYSAGLFNVNRTIFIHQHKYATKVFDRFSDCIPYPVATPAERNVKLSISSRPSSETEIDAMKDIPYREAVGSIMYLMVGTRPDMTFYMREISQFLVNPGMEH
ncbi:Hypothetical protein PHPALM_36206 [Phytophthora palmivora]|uniref:Uncharacterized protein n=1 Tax=Phytophthora palmivora TaxID=4796 RepID=A0A2P4X0J8_9STRA|nr:Hypothetical protein PHPALM_36206 [Phytophthora palmivora]